MHCRSPRLMRLRFCSNWETNGLRLLRHQRWWTRRPDGTLVIACVESFFAERGGHRKAGDALARRAIGSWQTSCDYLEGGCRARRFAGCVSENGQSHRSHAGANRGTSDGGEVASAGNSSYFTWSHCAGLAAAGAGGNRSAVILQLRRAYYSGRSGRARDAGRRVSGYDLEAGGAVGFESGAVHPRRASGFFMKVDHTKSVRAFSAMTMVMPVSIPMTSVSYHFFSGLKRRRTHSDSTHCAVLIFHIS